MKIITLLIFLFILLVLSSPGASPEVKLGRLMSAMQQETKASELRAADMAKAVKSMDAFLEHYAKEHGCLPIDTDRYGKCLDRGNK